MSGVVKQEFYRWIASLDVQALSDPEKRLINLLIARFDILSPLGTTAGARARKLSEMIQKEGKDFSTTLVDVHSDQNTSSERVEHIDELEIGPFRGFTVKEVFRFTKKYTFLYGPNGSGKSSFCEGLEYALLGSIEEASARRIPVGDYIRNAIKHDADIPKAYFTDSSGKKVTIDENQNLYRFAFIERNRIEGFARIAATTPSHQKDRIATLFGLDEFNNFVNGFTDNFAQYLSLENSAAKAFQMEKQKIDVEKARLGKIDLELTESATAFLGLVCEVGLPQQSTRDDIERFFIGKDNVSGKIGDLQSKKAERIPEDIEIESFDSIGQIVLKIRAYISKLEEDLKQLSLLSSNVYYRALYSAIDAIAEMPAANRSVCPACKTPISQVVINPFENAKLELEKLKSLSDLQDGIPMTSRNLVAEVRRVVTAIKAINDNASAAGYAGSRLSSISEVTFTDISSIATWIGTLSDECMAVEDQLKLVVDMKTLVERYNSGLAAKRTYQLEMDAEIRKYQDYNNRRLRIIAKEKSLASEKEVILASVKAFETANVKKMEEIENEDKMVAENQENLEAYSSLVRNLKAYRDRLPIAISSGLNERVKDFYNVINSYDPEFERLESVVLPAAVGEKITIKFNGDPELQDALHILSEGHLRVLGLAILLAKTASEDLGFLIFDDIVNAIDDDHRSGIADLLLTHADLKDRQHILTCHGEQFVNKLEHKLGTSRANSEVVRYRFRPTETAASRGVKLSIGDSKHYLLQAKAELGNDARKDAAGSCRQAVESLSETLWKKLCKNMNISLRVLMRAPGSQPDLSSVVDSLISELGKIDGKSSIFVHFKDLKEKYPWSLLNKGVHEQDSSPELEISDVDGLIRLIETIEGEVLAFKIETAIV